VNKFKRGRKQAAGAPREKIKNLVRRSNKTLHLFISFYFKKKKNFIIIKFQLLRARRNHKSPFFKFWRHFQVHSNDQSFIMIKSFIYFFLCKFFPHSFFVYAAIGHQSHSLSILFSIGRRSSAAVFPSILFLDLHDNNTPWCRLVSPDVDAAVPQLKYKIKPNIFKYKNQTQKATLPFFF
jgi:hypothetical protein